ncbi:MAG: hypothetical protein HYT42_00780 [Candidatus Sungbacteria bacterium]|uniref:Uncharacterized protein n=1 Tax=Candidatus Sungiibacteriota bacterium TaxID=2750080 RepID=A0A933DRL7_9BACT|nr:hypothetical protein [Candidatus Sungbacteria bacterium]MBI4132461.1 hypothetical protein [Candidatus Sungbacteria bacterium]
MMIFATEYDRWVSSDEIGDHAVHKTTALPGIPLTSNRGWWGRGQPYMVVLTPKGIFKYPYITGDYGKPFPHFQAGVESDRLWAQFGEYALSLLYPRPVTSDIKGRDTAGLFADIGQEYCRYCQCVAPASEFRMENRCPKCETDNWLAQYGVDAE